MTVIVSSGDTSSDTHKNASGESEEYFFLACESIKRCFKINVLLYVLTQISVYLNLYIKCYE